MDICDLIGKSVPAPKEAPAQSAVSHAGDLQPAAGQLGSTAGNSQYLYNSSHTGGVNGTPNVALPSMDCPTANPPASSVYSIRNLTQGAIVTMCFTSEVLEPVLQVFDLKLVQLQQNNTTEMYRLVLSDGLYYQQGMLVTQKNDLVHSERLQKGSIVKL